MTTFLGMGIMSTDRPLPMDRVRLVNPGRTLDVGDRTLEAFRPPLFDSPATVGCHDGRSQAVFSSDCFGAPLPSAELAGSDDADDIPADLLRASQLLWATVDSPWVHHVNEASYRATFQPLRAAAPRTVLSTHLPPAVGHTADFFDMLNTVPKAEPFVGPDQQALEELLADFEPAATPGT